MSDHQHGPPAAAAEGDERAVDVSERGAPRDGQPQTMDRRLFMQLLVFDCLERADPAKMIEGLAKSLGSRHVSAVLYEDVNAPRGIGILTWSEAPETFVRDVRPILNEVGSEHLRLRDEMTMLGRSYSSGYESDLEFWLIRRPVETVLNETLAWHVWYPLRRSGAFEKLEPREQAGVLREHAMIGRAYGTQDLAHDVRLACHGLDKNDNEFVIGLCGKALHPLSHVVQRMRKTKQTSEYIVQMGPFFVGHVAARVRP